MPELPVKIVKRKFLRKQITELLNGLKSPDTTLSESDKIHTRTKLVQINDEIKRLDFDIQQLTYSSEAEESALNAEFERCDEYSNKIIEAFTLLDRHLMSHPAEYPKQLLKSPVAPLPVYTGNDDESFIKFINAFEATTSRYNLAEYDKYILLKDQLKGRALVLIDSLETSKQSYTCAKELLELAFASTPIQKLNAIKSISQIKLNYNADPFEYISRIRKLTESVKLLKIDVEDFMQYFFWAGLNENFQDQLIQITNNNNPTLQEIIDNFFIASERYCANQKKFNNVNKTKFVKTNLDKNYKHSKSTNFAVSINKGDAVRQCVLCNMTDHRVQDCTKFPDSASKLKKLKDLKRCTRCCQVNHVARDCKFPFYRPCYCNEWHFSFLCPKFKGNKEKIEEKTKETLNNLIVIDSYVSHFNSEGGSILPTFTCAINDNYLIRALKDGGSQGNFILESIANKLNLKVIEDNINLKLNGFNGSQNYNTKSVLVQLKIGESIYDVPAICIPKIRIQTDLPKLSNVVEAFVAKGYKLADERLNDRRDKISDIEFVLGAKSGYCLKSREISFGMTDTSIYSDCALGVMLLGDIEGYLKDLPHLPDINKIQSKVKVKNDKSSHVQCLAIEKVDVNRTELEKCTAKILNIVEYDEEISSDFNKDLIKYALENMTKDDQGRLQVPLLWRGDVSHFLAKNYVLTKSVLQSNYKRMSKKPLQLKLMDDSFKEQINLGILEKIVDLDSYLKENPGYSFLPHMGVFRPNRETTKCRIVYLSNLNGNDSGLSMSVSHNQAMYSGPCLNQKIASAILHLRFDKHLLIFDLAKAFNMLSLSDQDSSKLLCLWYKDVENNDFSLVAYINRRLPFGLRCSPTLLMLALYKILVLDSAYDSPEIKYFKHVVYQCMYVDNGAFTSNSEQSLIEGLEMIRSVFGQYMFEVQQVEVNGVNLNNGNNISLSEKPNIEKEPKAETNLVKVLGIYWDKNDDTFSTAPINLNKKANTKRLVLQSIAEQYDIFNYNAPLLNRARIFLQQLQSNKKLSWDSILDPDLVVEWANIVNQANGADLIKVFRNFGNRQDVYRLIACTDASAKIYGTVVYMHNLTTNKINFVLAKNHLFNSQLELKTIPCKELLAISLGCEVLINIYNDLSGPETLIKINIESLVVYSDSLVALTWVNSYFNKFEKMQKRNVFSMNRIKKIQENCSIHPIQFEFISGVENPADLVSRCVSSRTLLKSNYLSGPSFFTKPDEYQSLDTLRFTVPNPHINIDNNNKVNSFSATVVSLNSHLVDPLRFSSFTKIVRVHARVLYFVHLLKRKVNSTLPSLTVDEFFNLALTQILINLQRDEFGFIFDYFEKPNKRVKDIPNIVSQLNIYVDKKGLLRMKSKFGRWNNGYKFNFPILLPKNSNVTKLIILDVHKTNKHAGIYSVLSELRKRFWIPTCFSVVKKAIRECVTCRRFNNKPIQINQNAYRDFRVNPSDIPYSYIFIDYIGPFEVKMNKSNSKVWLLIITCLWSRSVSLKICIDYSTKEFLRAFQLHIMDWGIPQLCTSDMGSQLVSGSKIITDFLKDVDSKQFFAEKGIKEIEFSNYVKGRSELGSLVESLVKNVKKLVYSSIGKNRLHFRDFEFLVSEVQHVINRRPIAFKEGLRNVIDGISSPITPEILTKGFEVPSINVVPDLQPIEGEPDWSNHLNTINKNYDKLRKVRKALKEKYHTEFYVNLINQATNQKNLYQPKCHHTLNVGDIILVKDPNCKSYNYPMGVVKSVEYNSLGETVSAEVLKGGTKELVRRHVTSLIPLLGVERNLDQNLTDPVSITADNSVQLSCRPKRKAAEKANLLNQHLSKQHLI